MNNCYINQQNLPSAKKPKKKYKKLHMLVPVDDDKMGYVPFQNPYVDISAEAYSLRSQLKNGVHLQECGVQSLEGVHGSDKLRLNVESIINEE